MTRILAGDIGGTKTSLLAFEADDGPRVPIAEATFASGRYQSLEAVVKEFVTTNRLSVKYASFGVAGPVIGGRARITNLPWSIEKTALKTSLGLADVHLLNDVEAIATAVPSLEVQDLHTLNEGEPLANGTIAVVAPGTGLGEAFSMWRGSGYISHPSEGGHVDFAPTDDSQADLLRFLLKRLGHVSYERVCSGIGIRNIHEYLKAVGPPERPAWHERELEAEPDPVPVISEAALAKNPKCEICVDTFKMFVSILGAEAGNLALKVLATRGVYIGGGIPRKVLPLLGNGMFMQSFVNKGRMSGLVSRVPVYVIVNPKAALLGAARSGVDRIRGLERSIATETRAA